MRADAQIQAVIELLDEVLETRYPADRLLSQYFRQRRYIGAKDKAAIAERFYAILRCLASNSWLVGHEDGFATSRLLVAVDLLRSGNSPDDYFSGERYAPRYLSAEEKALLPSEIDSVLQQAPKHVQLDVPQWLLAALEQSLGESLEVEMQAMQQRASTDIRVNTLKRSRDALLKSLQDQDIDAQATPLSPWGIRFGSRVSLLGMEAFKRGEFEVQDQGSQLLALATNVGPGQKVVDFCAGAGGKTLALAAMMDNKGAIHACDTHSRRLQELGKRAKRAGVFNVRTHSLSSENDKWVKRHAGQMDVVLIDAPCTGSGTWRRNPDARWNLTQDSLTSLQKTQQSILQSAARLVKPGGRLVYATCSLLLEENQHQAAWFLQENPAFEPAALDLDVDAALTITENQLQTLPARDDTDGFFAATFIRRRN